ncbi:MAG: acetyl-CoA carboxylase biotin carboxyl carrier protein [Gammaproteobacteria bacterium]|nr:acetyl-CoA carboxylase biotin carboxyl carrier protein [Gammaproteobacteria bacterium]
MDLRKIKKLIELVEESGIAELEVSSGDESVRIAMISNTPRVINSVPVTAATAVVTSSSATNSFAVESPMAGTFYRSPDPESEPYIDVGSTVQVGDVICVIESMKMMHEVHATQAGTVAELCVANAQPVSTGEVLFRLL